MSEHERVKGWDHHPMTTAEAQRNAPRPQLQNYVTAEMMAAIVRRPSGPFSLAHLIDTYVAQRPSMQVDY